MDVQATHQARAVPEESASEDDASDISEDEVQSPALSPYCCGLSCDGPEGDP